MYKLAAAFSTYGIPEDQARSVCVRFQDLHSPDPFTSREIAEIVQSAYRRVPYAIKVWTPNNKTKQQTLQTPGNDRAQQFIRKHQLEKIVEILDLDMDRAGIIYR
jgi:hypothetical protein